MIKKTNSLLKFLLCSAPLLYVVPELVWQGALGQFVPTWASKMLQDHPAVFLVLGLLGSSSIFCFLTLLEAKAELEALRGHDPDLPLGDAIDYIQTTKRKWKRVSPEGIRGAIEQLALDERIIVWGNNNLDIGMMSIPSGLLVKIPHKFFFSVTGGPSNDAGYCLKIFNSLPGWSDWRNYQQFCNVTLNHDQIDAIFSRNEPKNK